MLQKVGYGKIGIPDFTDNVEESLADSSTAKIGELKIGAGYCGGNIAPLQVFARVKQTDFFCFKVISSYSLSLFCKYKVMGQYYDYAIHFPMQIKAEIKGIFHVVFLCIGERSIIATAKYFKLKGVTMFKPSFYYGIFAEVMANYLSAPLRLTGALKQRISFTFAYSATLKALYKHNYALLGRSKLTQISLFLITSTLSSNIAMHLKNVGSIIARQYVTIAIKGKLTTLLNFNMYVASGKTLILKLIGSLSCRKNSLPAPTGVKLFNDTVGDAGERRVRK